MTSSTDAFVLLQLFRRRALPTLLRKLHIWKGLSSTHHADLIEDLEQELWLDCLENPQLIVELPSRERHTRWFRLIEKNHYRLHLRSERQRASDAAMDALTDSNQLAGSQQDDLVTTCGGELGSRERTVLRRLQTSARYLKNGRINCRVSAASLGMRPAELRRLWSRVASDLGLGPEYLQFWRRRLVEALIGLAADLLRDAGLVSVHDEERRRRPDPRGRLLRIRRLRRQIDRRPIPLDMKSVLTHYQTRNRHCYSVPREILADAQRLAPADPAVHLWSFEAALVDDDFAAAAHSIREARRCRAAAVPVLLARARLLEARGEDRRAQRLLAAGLSRQSGDARLSTAIECLAG